MRISDWSSDVCSSDLNALRRSLIDCVARHPELDSEGVKCHLSNQGYLGLLAALLSPEVYVHGRFARPDASVEVARQSVLHILGVLHDRHSGALQFPERVRKLVLVDRKSTRLNSSH